MKRNLLRNLLAAIALVGATSVSAETGAASVKMTYVDGEEGNTAVSKGEIVAGEAAMSGYNKISGGSVELAFSGWHVNYITYIQVDASAIEGTITGATLTAEVSGSTDSKRATVWGVGYNSSAWSADLTYDTADRTITTVGAKYTTTSKSATEFETATFDISNALVSDDDKVVTLLVYNETAGGGYIKNPTVEVTYLSGASAAAYTVKYVLTGTDTEVKESTSGVGEIGGYYTLTDDDKASCFSNDVKYIYESDNTATQTIAANGSTVITVNFREAAKWAYTLKSNLGVTLKEGTDWEGETLTVAYPRHQVSEGTLYSIAANTAAKDYFERTFTLSENNHVETIEYTATETTGVVFLSEAEDIATLTVSTAPNSNIRCSNGLCAYNAGEGDAVIATLPAGKYVLYTSVWGNADTDFIFKAGETQVLSAPSMGYIQDYNSEEFELTDETDITLGATTNAARGIDFVYIVKTDAEEDLPTVENIAALKALEDGAEVKLMLNNTQVTLQAMSMTGGMQTIIEDATGGIQILTSGMDDDYSDEPSLFSQIFTEIGQTFNGYIYCRYRNNGYGTVGIEAIDGKTTTDTYEVEITDVVPRELTLDEACNENEAMRFIKISRLTLEQSDEAMMGFLLRQGNTMANLVDLAYQVIPSFYDDEGNLNYPAFVDNVTGYVYNVYEDEYAFVPMSLTAMENAPVAAENIAALKALVDEAAADTDEETAAPEYALTLDGTKVTLWGPSAYAMNSYIEDETGAIKIDFNVTNNILDGEGVALTGKLIGTVSKDKNGAYLFELGDNTDLSYIDSEETTIVPTSTTIADINADEAASFAKFVRLENVTLTSEESDYSITYYLHDGDNTIVLDDAFWLLSDLLDAYGSFTYIEGIIDYDYDGNIAFQPYGDFEGELIPATEVNSIAELKALKSGTSAQINLKDVVVTAVELSPYSYFGDEYDVYIEDASGAIKIGSDLTEYLSENPFTKVGNTLSGTLYGTYYDRGGEISLNSSIRTEDSQVTVTEGTATPTAVEIKDITAADEFRLVKISDATMTIDNMFGPTLVQGEKTIIVQDRYYKILDLIAKLSSESEEEPAAVSLNIASATGIVMKQIIDRNEETNEYTYAYFLIPVGENPVVEGVADGINSVNSAIVNNGDIYTINGVKVRKAGESLNGLAKGLYIVNGKKVVIK